MPRIGRLYGKGEYLWARHEYHSSYAMLCLTSNVVTSQTKSQEMTAFTFQEENQDGDGLFAAVTMPVLVHISNVIARVTKDCIIPIDDEKVIKILKKELFLMSVMNLKFWVAENNATQLPLVVVPLPGHHKDNRLFEKIDEAKVNPMLICKAIIENIVKGIIVNSVTYRRQESIKNNVDDKRKAPKKVPRKRSLQKLNVKSNVTPSLKRKKIAFDNHPKSICLDLVKDVIEHVLYLISIKTFFIKVEPDEHLKSKCLSKYGNCDVTPVESRIFYSFSNEEDLQKHCSIETSLSKVTEVIKIKEFIDKV